MQILIAMEVLALIALATWVVYMGVSEAERIVARWLLLDARGWDGRADAKKHHEEAVRGIC